MQEEGASAAAPAPDGALCAARAVPALSAVIGARAAVAAAARTTVRRFGVDEEADSGAEEES